MNEQEIIFCIVTNLITTCAFLSCKTPLCFMKVAWITH